jgi:Uma2 family endonuclease
MAQAVTTVPRWELGSRYGKDGFFYPAEEEREVPLSDQAILLIIYLRQALHRIFFGRKDVYVGADQFIYWVPNNARKRVAPDVYVLKSVPSEPPREVIRVWEEAVPSLVVEVSSQDSRTHDRGRKMEIYQDVLGCPEYLVYDVDRGELLLYFLVDGVYQLQAPDEQGRVQSRETGAWFGPDPACLVRVYDAELRPIPDLDELYEDRALLERIAARREQELHDLQAYLSEVERQRAKESQTLQAQAAELAAENECLRVELERLRAERDR